jgi:hypothetical protein
MKESIWNKLSMYLMFSAVMLTHSYCDFRNSIKDDSRAIGRSPTTGERTALEDRRMRLRTRIDAFHQRVQGILGENRDEFPIVQLPETPHEDEHWEDEDRDDDDDEPDDETVGEWPENMTLAMPSTFGDAQCQRLGLKDLLDQEMELRLGQANDCLEKLRVALGHKMILFRTRVRNSTSQRTRTRAWAEVERVDIRIRKSARSYRQARQAMIRLGANAEILAQYQVIKKEDLKLSGDVVEENRIGQRNEKLAWFWKLGVQECDDDNWMQECECSIMC